MRSLVRGLLEWMNESGIPMWAIIGVCVGVFIGAAWLKNRNQ